MSKNDPMHTPITITLESLTNKSYALTKSRNNTYILWLYDPRNRIMTPTVLTFNSLEELLASLAASIIDTTDDDPKIKTVLERSAKIGELFRLEFKEKAHFSGGYSSMDPNEPQNKIILDHVKGKYYAEQAKKLREELGIHDTTA